MYVERKWQVNREKNEHARSCPGLVVSLKETVGRRIEAVIPLNLPGKSPMSILVFEGGCFFIASDSGEVQPPELLGAIEAVRTTIGPHFPDFYQKLDRLSSEDREMQRLARLENILGAIRNNAGQIPELMEAVRLLLSEMEAGTAAPSCPPEAPRKDSGTA
ncbi:MAG: hypothetical protein ACYCYP_01155 [Leptospirales bacterium]